MDKFDPNGVFLNNFGKRLQGLSFKQDLDPADNRCAIRDNCICNKNSDCPITHTCTTLSGYINYNVCQTIGETPIIFENEIVLDPFNMSIIVWLQNTLSKLSTLVQYFTSAVGCMLLTKELG